MLNQFKSLMDLNQVYTKTNGSKLMATVPVRTCTIPEGYKNLYMSLSYRQKTF